MGIKIVNKKSQSTIQFINREQIVGIKIEELTHKTVMKIYMSNGYHHTLTFDSVENALTYYDDNFAKFVDYRFFTPTAK